jgi:hypothetical protein
MTELEKDSQAMSRELNGLWELNQELQEAASKGNPETERAVDARNAAFRKLRHARKVIRDLLDERRVNLIRTSWAVIVDPTILVYRLVLSQSTKGCHRYLALCHWREERQEC